MQEIYFATTNKEKIHIAETVCGDAGLTLKTVALDIDEIQGEDPELIVIDKAKRAYEILKMPVVVSDDSWDIKALNGFPGAYMKSVNYWFKPDDFLRLMNGIEDRRITLHQYLAYTDGRIMKVFHNEIHGQIIEEVQGHSDKSPNMTVTVLDSDNGKTIAQVHEEGAKAVSERYKNQPDAWHDLIDYFKKNL